MWVRLWVLASLAGAAVLAVSTDSDMASALDNSVDSDSLVISIKHIRPRRKQQLEAEKLLSIGTRTSNEIFTVLLDRANKKVIVETLKEKKHFHVDSLNEHRIIKSLVLFIDQSTFPSEIQLYVDCVLEGKHLMDLQLKKFFKKDPKFEVVRERKYFMELDSDTGIQEILERLRCDVHDQMLAASPDDNDGTVVRRGDIPIFSDCDDTLLVKAINKLIGVVNQLQDQLESQRSETNKLRQLLEECDICKPGERY